MVSRYVPKSTPNVVCMFCDSMLAEWKGEHQLWSSSIFYLWWMVCKPNCIYPKTYLQMCFSPMTNWSDSLLDFQLSSGTYLISLFWSWPVWWPISISGLFMHSLLDRSLEHQSTRPCKKSVAKTQFCWSSLYRTFPKAFHKVADIPCFHLFFLSVLTKVLHLPAACLQPSATLYISG